MTENAIIILGQAALSGSGSGNVVGRGAIPSGVQFAFTNRFIAFVERARKSVAQLSFIVTNLPTTRQDHAVLIRNAPASIVSGMSGRGAALLFFPSLTLSQSARCLLGRLR